MGHDVGWRAVSPHAYSLLACPHQDTTKVRVTFDMRKSTIFHNDAKSILLLLSWWDGESWPAAHHSGDVTPVWHPACLCLTIALQKIFCCWLKSSVSNNIQHNVRTPLSLGTALHPIPPLGSDNDVIVILTVEYWCWSDCDWYGHNWVVGDYHCRSIHLFANCCIDKAQKLCYDLVNYFWWWLLNCNDGWDIAGLRPAQGDHETIENMLCLLVWSGWILIDYWQLSSLYRQQSCLCRGCYSPCVCLCRSCHNCW